MSEESGDANARRAAAINWLLAFAEVIDLPRVSPGQDLGSIDRARYERRLGLLPGSLSLGRFVTDFAAGSAAAIGERLLDEAYAGQMFRLAPAKRDEPAPIEPEPLERSDRFEGLLSEIDLRAEEVMMLSGSRDVASTFARWGAYAPDLRRPPGNLDVTRFGLAVIGRGQAGHKDFEPYTQLIKTAGKHQGPTMLTSPSSNVSGILEFLWRERLAIRRYVDAWRS